MYINTVAFAESTTAGRLAYEFSMTEDSGNILIGGLVCYDASIKEQILGVDHAMVEKFTPESAEVTREMAYRLKDLVKSDIQVAVTGLTTPGGSETEEKSVGTMFVHILIQGVSFAIRQVFHGSPEDILTQTVKLVAQTITEKLKYQIA